MLSNGFVLGFLFGVALHIVLHKIDTAQSKTKAMQMLQDEISLMRQDIQAVNSTGRDPYTGGRYGQSR